MQLVPQSEQLSATGTGGERCPSCRMWLCEAAAGPGAARQAGHMFLKDWTQSWEQELEVMMLDGKG